MVGAPQIQHWLAHRSALHKPNKRYIKNLLLEYYPLIAILIGAALITFPIGPFSTLDTQLELDTTKGVLQWGYPYYNATGNLFNEPPLGFYTAAAFFSAFGVSEANGALMVTLFGLASIVVMYFLGKELYDKTTGYVAAALFAIAPWQLILSRAFLIDTQTLFLSLVYLYFGILTIRRNSINYAAVAGVFFALALLTKLFAVFMLIPLLLLYVYQRPNNAKRVLGQLGAFSLPAVFSTLLWYQVINGKPLLYLVVHNDFVDLNFTTYVPTYAVMQNFLVNYGLGLVFFVAVLVSFAFGFALWKQFPKKVLVADVVCLVSLAFVWGLVMYLGVNVNLKAPYVSAVKYAYQSLPFFCLAVGSLATKGILLLKTAKQKSPIRKEALFAIGIVAVVLVSVAVLACMNMARELALAYYLIFRVEPGIDVGYAFHVDSPLAVGSPLLWVQFFGFVVLVSGFVWAGRHRIRGLLNRVRQ